MKRGFLFLAPTNAALGLLGLAWLGSTTALAIANWLDPRAHTFLVVLTIGSTLFGLYMVYQGSKWWAWVDAERIILPYRVLRLAQVVDASLEEASPTQMYRRSVPVLTLDDGTRIRVTALVAPRVFRTQRRFVESILAKLEGSAVGGGGASVSGRAQMEAG